MSKSKKLKKMHIVVFEPEWGKNGKVDKKHPLKYGEQVLYLGNMVNVPGHCVVVKHSGETIMMVHPGDLRDATEEEL